MTSVEAYIAEQLPHHRPVLQQLRQLILQASPKIQESMKYRLPFYTYYGLLCYLNVQQDEVVLGFCRGKELSNDHGLLSGNLKEVRHIRFRQPFAINPGQLRAIMQEALLLNEWKKFQSGP